MKEIVENIQFIDKVIMLGLTEEAFKKLNSRREELCKKLSDIVIETDFESTEF